MLRLRLIVPDELTDVVVDGLAAHAGVAHIVRDVGTPVRPAGVAVHCDVVREAGNELVEWLQMLGVHRDGAITIDPVDVAISDAAQLAEAEVPGTAADALVWEEVEGRVREESSLSVSFVLFMSIAAIISAIGIVIDSAILVIGAMVVGPDYGPLAAMCVGIVRRRAHAVGRATRTLVVGLAVAAGAALVASVLFRVTGIAPDRYGVGERELTSFISRPDAFGAIVAVLAGVIGMLALTEARAGALIGVLVSVTTIPAVGNVGLAAAYGQWEEVGGAALQLAVNVVGLVLAGVVTLVAQARFTSAEPNSRST